MEALYVSNIKARKENLSKIINCCLNHIMLHYTIAIFKIINICYYDNLYKQKESDE